MAMEDFARAQESNIQRNQPAILGKSLELAVIARVFHAKRTGESVLLNMPRRPCSLFLRRASEQSGFNDSIRRTQCDAESFGHLLSSPSPRKLGSRASSNHTGRKGCLPH